MLKAFVAKNTKGFRSSLLLPADITDLHVHVSLSACQTVHVVA